MAAEARKLREWFREFVHNHAGKTLETDTIKALVPLNTLLAKSKVYKQIAPSKQDDENTLNHDSIFEWQDYRQWESVDDLLIVIAEAMGALVCTVDFARIKNCEGPTCTLWFYDVSKNHSRRWCTMSICGNRAKAALHRAKKKSAALS